MTSFAPVNPRGSPAAILVDDLDDAPPGAFEFYSYGDAIPDAGILLRCPCGCPAEIAMPFKRPARANDTRPVWTWDGNRDRPTATPSLLIYQLNDRGERVGEHWHGFLTAGQWRSC